MSVQFHVRISKATLTDVISAYVPLYARVYPYGRNVCVALRFEMLRCGYVWEYAMDSQWTIIATWLVHLHQLAPATYSCRSGCLEGAWHAGRMISARIWTRHR
jgi:hypothetical protein